MTSTHSSFVCSKFDQSVVHSKRSCRCERVKGANLIEIPHSSFAFALNMVRNDTPCQIASSQSLPLSEGPPVKPGEGLFAMTGFVMQYRKIELTL